MAVHFSISVTAPHTHHLEVHLVLEQALKRQRVALPVWAPGSYLVREFSRHLSGLDCSTHSLQQINKNTWEVACQAGERVELHYRIYAFDRSVRTAYLDDKHGFFNGTSVYLRCHGLEQQAHSVQLHAYKNWKLATALSPSLEHKAQGSNGFGVYLAPNYDALADTPVVMGDYTELQFKVRDIQHRMVVLGAPPTLDQVRLQQDSQRIVEEVMAFWHPTAAADEAPPPQRDYLFIVLCSESGYGGLEHRNSTVLLCSRTDLPRLPNPLLPSAQSAEQKTYANLLGLISHEYFHTWFVKSLKPAELAQIDYDRENHTELLWMFEGFTSYYDDLLVLRCGLLDEKAYFKRLAQSINHVENAPARTHQSVAEASFDAWTKYYRQDANTPNVTVSYYSKGALLALCFDLSLRALGCSLDVCMRALWQQYGPHSAHQGAIRETDFAAVLQEQTGKDWSAELAAWVHGTKALPLAELLQAQGVSLYSEPAPLAQSLGMRVQESAGGLFVKQVYSGGLAEQAGLAPEDEVLALQVAGQRWRVRTLESLLLYADKDCSLWIARDGVVFERHLQLPEQPKQQWQLARSSPPSAQVWPFL